MLFSFSWQRCPIRVLPLQAAIAAYPFYRARPLLAIAGGYMEIQMQTSGPSKWHADIAIAFGFDDEKLLEKNPGLADLCPWLSASPALADFCGKSGEIVLAHGVGDLVVPRLLLAGLGKREELNPSSLRKAMAKCLRKIRSLGLKTALLPEPQLATFGGGRERLLEECVCAAILGLYRFDQLKTVRKDILPDPEWLAIGFEAETVPDSGLLAARKGEQDAWALSLARDLDNMPGNLLYPETLALRANALAAEHGFSCAVIDESQMDEESMGCLLAVGSGSSHPPRLVVCEYAPEGHEQDKPLVLIGKGITFDSGGLCLKPAANMSQMKSDMSGAAAVLAVIASAAIEKLPRRIIALLPCAENMPDGGAYRPGDILVSASGETVEVINTDAEGRLVLCDALAYAQKRWTAQTIVDIATLTGACAVALGNQLAGLFCENTDLAARLQAAGTVSGEDAWRLPLWDPYAEALKSNVADISHTASREGGAITAALFLKHFVKDPLIWAHLDIAGVDWQAKDSPLCPEGPTGFGVRTLLEFARGGQA